MDAPMTPAQANKIMDMADEMQEERRIRYNDNLNLYLNKINDDEDAPASPNYIYATVSQEAAILLPKDPHWVAKADRRGYERQEVLLPSLLKKMFKSTKMLRTLRHVFLSSVIWDFGAIKLGMGMAYNPKSEQEKIEENRLKARDENMKMLAGNVFPVEQSEMHEIELLEHFAFLESPALLQHPAADSVVSNLETHIREHQAFAQVPHTPMTDFDSYKQPDFPFGKAVMPIDLYWEPGHMFFDEAGWVAHGTWHRKEDLVGHPLMDQNVVKKLQGETLDDTFQHLYPDGEWNAIMNSEDDILRVWEIWNHRLRVREIWVKGNDKPLYRPPNDPRHKWPYHHIEKYPFNILALSQAPGRTHGRAPLHYMEHGQRLEMDIMESIALHIQRSVPKYELDVEMLEGREQIVRALETLRSGSHGGVIMTKKDGDAGKRAVIPVATAQMDQTNLIMLQLLEKNRPVNSGLADQARGITTGATATETQITSSATNVRLNDFIGLVTELTQWVGTTSLQIWRQFAPESMELRVTMGRMDVWEEFKRTDLLPYYDLDVFLPQPGDEQKRAVEIQNTIHMFAQVPQLAEVVDFEQLGRELLFSMNPGHTDLDRYFKQESAAEMVAIQNEERLMAQGQQVEVTADQMHSVHMQAHQVFMQRVAQSMQNPETQEAAQTILQVLQQHIQQHMQFIQSPLIGRNRDARFNRDGNPGTDKSITSAAAQGV